MSIWEHSMNGAAPKKIEDSRKHFRRVGGWICLCLLKPPTGEKIDRCDKWAPAPYDPDRCTWRPIDSDPRDNALCTWSEWQEKNLQAWSVKIDRQPISPMKYMWAKSYKQKDCPT